MQQDIMHKIFWLKCRKYQEKKSVVVGYVKLLIDSVETLTHNHFN